MTKLERKLFCGSDKNYLTNQQMQIGYRFLLGADMLYI
jgi:hypothetical protein